MSTCFKDIFVSLLSIEGINKEAEAWTQASLQRLSQSFIAFLCSHWGRASRVSPACKIQPKSQPPHCKMNFSSPCQPIKAVKKAWRKQAWQLFHAPPAYIHVVFLHCFWSSHGIWPFLPSGSGYRSNLQCQPLLWFRLLKYQAVSKLRQLWWLYHHTLWCPLGKLEPGILFFTHIGSSACWQKGLKINRERVLVQTSIHILAPACSLSKPTVCDPLMIQVYPTKNKGFFFTHNHLPHVSLLGGNLQYEMQGCLQRKVNNLPRMVPCSPLIKGNVS